MLNVHFYLFLFHLGPSRVDLPINPHPIQSITTFGNKRCRKYVIVRVVRLHNTPLSPWPASQWAVNQQASCVFIFKLSHKWAGVWFSFFLFSEDTEMCRVLTAGPGDLLGHGGRYRMSVAHHSYFILGYERCRLPITHPAIRTSIWTHGFQLLVCFVSIV